MGVGAEEVVSAAFAAVRKRGIVVRTGMGGLATKNVHVSGSELTAFEKRLQGALFGSGDPFDDIRMIELYRAGKLKLDEVITTRYKLEVNRGYEDDGGPQHPRRDHPRALRLRPGDGDGGCTPIADLSSLYRYEPQQGERAITASRDRLLEHVNVT